MKIVTTNRGFERIEFKDLNGRPSSLQQSSLAEHEPPGTSAVWLGCEDQRMHLRGRHVRELIRFLQAWEKYGSFHGKAD